MIVKFCQTFEMSIIYEHFGEKNDNESFLFGGLLRSLDTMWHVKELRNVN